MTSSSATCVIAIDAGTTGVRSRAVFAADAPAVASYREFAQHYPQPGWVEHDADEIWQAVRSTLADVVDTVGVHNVRAIGITNQRETVVAWNRRTGQPYGTAIVWQDRRTAATCAQLTAAGHLAKVREVTGLVLDPYFSATKMAWLINERGLPADQLADGTIAVGTIDSWILWNLTGGEVFATDVTNASRTLLFDIRSLAWSDEMCTLFGVPKSALPSVQPSSGRFGLTSAACGVAAGLPISGIAGDQQAALFGQACFQPGQAKNTYGTGSFLLLNVGATCPPPADGMLTTVAWQLADGSVAYALEGAIFVTGAAIQWLRDGLGIIADAADVGPLAQSVDSSDGVYFVPALTGLGSPWWDPHARGTIVGLTRGTTRAHIARAVIDSIVLQVRDVVEAMQTAAGTTLADVRVDGGASVMDFMLQLQADHLGVAVHRPTDLESTARGAALLAGLAEGVWTSLDDIRGSWSSAATFTPSTDRSAVDAAHRTWLRAVQRSRNWETDEASGA